VRETVPNVAEPYQRSPRLNCLIFTADWQFFVDQTREEPFEDSRDIRQLRMKTGLFRKGYARSSSFESRTRR